MFLVVKILHTFITRHALNKYLYTCAHTQNGKFNFSGTDSEVLLEKCQVIFNAKNVLVDNVSFFAFLQFIYSRGYEGMQLALLIFEKKNAIVYMFLFCTTIERACPASILF